MSDPFGSGDVGLGSGRDSPRGGAGGRSPAAATASSSSGQRNQLQNTQQKVDEVVNIMRVNVEKVLERDQKLSDLDNRADALRHGASQFEQQAGKLKRKYWWNNIKMMIIIGLVVLFLIIIIIITVYSKYSGGEDTTTTTTTTAPPPPPSASP